MRQLQNGVCLALIKYLFIKRFTTKSAIYLAFLILSQGTLVYAQSSKVDSLKNLLERPLPDSTHFDILLQLASKLEDKNSKNRYYRNALEFIPTLKDQHRVFNVINNYAQWLREKGVSSDSIILVYKSGLEALNDPKYSIPIYYALGEFYFGQGEDEKAEQTIYEGIKLADERGSARGIARGYVVLGNGQFYKLEYEKAFTLYTKADSVCEANEELKVTSLRAKILNYIGYTVRVTHGYDKVIDYYLNARDIYMEIGDQVGLQEVNLGIAQYYTNKGDYDKAESLLTGAINYYRDRGPRSSYTYGIISRGYLFLSQKKYDEALKDYQLYYDIAFEGTNKLFQLNALNYMSYIYLEMKKFDLAAQFGEEAIKLSKEIGERETRKKVYEQLIRIYTEDEATERLNQTYEDYLALRNELDSIGKDKEIFDLEAKYQSEKKEQEIALLTTQNQLAEQEKQNQLYLFLGLMALVLIFTVVFFILYRNRQKVALKLQELDSAKSNFFANISHELRTPLTLIKGPVEDQLSKKELDEESYTNLLMINRNANRLIELVDQLLDLSKLESGNMRLQIEKGQALGHIRAIASSFQYAADQKYIKYDIDVPVEESDSWFDKDALEKIAVNLLSNAIKYTPEKGEIKVLASLSKGSLTFSVRNTGIGISAKEIERVLDRFYQSDSTREGAGIGLALVNELAMIHKGKLAVKSIENEFTLFEVILPVAKENFKSDELRSTFTISNKESVDHTEIVSPVDQEGLAFDESKPLLLIVEDNADVRKLVSNIFKDDFQIIEAEDGEQGIESAIKNVPNIIISDLMMPVKDGMVLCQTIKEDERTSHIPIILLTAKAGDEHVVAGLETGADDYIVKPFSNDVLKVKVEKLIELRASLRQRYSQEIILKPQEIAITSADENFLSRVEKLLDEKLSDSDFTADIFSKEIGMSRMQLHRKLKALVGLTTTEFIRSQRLKVASQILQKPGINMSEVAYAVGFNDPSYFSKCFKEAYGHSPSAYAKSKSA
ncbi:MAG: response regulator [Fulvivirga sp.]